QAGPSAARGISSASSCRQAPCGTVQSRGRKVSMSDMTPTRSEGAREAGIVAAVQTAADLLSILGSYLAVACTVGLTLLVLAEILAATLARVIPSVPASIHVGWEYSGYLMGASFLLGAGMTL